MKPDLHTVLGVLGQRIRSDAVPALATPYLRAQLLRGLELLKTVTEEMDRAVAWRVEEVEALRALLKAAVPRLDADAPDLAFALLAAVAEPVTDLRLRALDTRLGALRQQLAALHAWTESSRSQAAADLNGDVWHELRLSTERRRHGMDRF